MKAFVETTEFSRWLQRFLPGDTYIKLQRELIENPRKGDVMPGCGGLRKLRIADPKRQKGKRGGARVIYLPIPEANQFLMLDVYGKGDKDDLTPSEKRDLRELAREYKRLIVEAARKAKKDQEP
ncbi:MAG: type II toxin-antitoxin system RelE/ParE family toxin [Pirellulaceae bacterium]|nr:type II toxin-antitoxin system RelE/ParE family toxin [Pirellulaceae bacterium]